MSYLTTSAIAHIANSTEYNWSAFPIQLEVHTHTLDGIVASTELLLSENGAREVIEQLQNVILKLENTN